MGRPKEFDREEALTKGLELFWQQGFSDTSTQQLVEHLGINRKSMYAEFGNKQKFFEAALQRYSQIVDQNFGPLEEPAAALTEIKALFRYFADESKGRAAGLGCLMCNTAIEQAQGELATRRHVTAYIKRVTKAFANALANAQQRGEVSSKVDLKAQAQFLTSTVLGMSVLAKARAAPDLIDGSLQVTLDHLDALSG